MSVCVAMRILPQFAYQAQDVESVSTGLMLVHRLQCRSNIKPALIQHLVFAWMATESSVGHTGAVI